MRSPDRLVMIWSVPLDHPDQLNGVTAYNYLAFQERAKSFESMGMIRTNVCNIGADEHGQPPERVDCENYTPSMFQTLGVKPILGRVLAEDENPIDTPARVLLISNRFWQRRFNGDRNVIGQISAGGWIGQDHHRRDAAEFLLVRRAGRFLRLPSTGPVRRWRARSIPAASPRA